VYIGIPLYENWGYAPDAHVTLTFNGHGESKHDYLSAVSALAETALWWHDNANGLIDLRYGPTGCFGGNVWHATVKSKKLARFRERLVQNLDRFGVYHAEDFEYTPHVTLNYGMEPEDNPYEGGADLVREFAVESRAFGRTLVRV
jgi:2'-5' RNA ligase